MFKVELIDTTQLKKVGTGAKRLKYKQGKAGIPFATYLVNQQQVSNMIRSKKIILHSQTLSEVTNM